MRACMTRACGAQVMTFSVAMNSARGHALVALLIASNFVEIKGAPGSSSGLQYCMSRAPLRVGVPATSLREAGCPRCH